MNINNIVFKKSVKKKIIAIDIDETLCTNLNPIRAISDYKKSQPIKEMISFANQLYKEHYIILYTARGKLLTKKNINLQKKLRRITINQLNDWNVKYHELNMNKIFYDLIIDDKSANPLKGLKKLIKEIKS